MLVFTIFSVRIDRFSGRFSDWSAEISIINTSETWMREKQEADRDSVRLKVRGHRDFPEQDQSHVSAGLKRTRLAYFLPKPESGLTGSDFSCWTWWRRHFSNQSLWQFWTLHSKSPGVTLNQESDGSQSFLSWSELSFLQPAVLKYHSDLRSMCVVNTSSASQLQYWA